MAKDTDSDDRVLVLRDGGRSFAAISKELGLASAVEASAAFNRALRRRVPADQDALREREVARLDALGERVRHREDLSEEEVDRRLRGLQRLRKALYVA